MVSKKLLDTRTKIKKRKPLFRRVQSNQYVKIARQKNWRRPKGLDNKIRLQKRSKISLPAVGYKSPKEVRGLNREGKREVLVHNAKDLENVGKESVAVIASNVGAKKRLSILEKGKEKGVEFSNIRDVDGAIQSYKKDTSKKKSSNSKQSTSSKEDSKESSSESTSSSSGSNSKSGSKSSSSSTSKSSSSGNSNKGTASKNTNKEASKE